MTYEEFQSIPKLSHACQHVNCNHCTGRRFETSTEDDCPCRCHAVVDVVEGLDRPRLVKKEAA